MREWVATAKIRGKRPPLRRLEDHNQVQVHPNKLAVADTKPMT